MADNTAQNGTSTIATEDVNGAHYQKIIPSPEAHAAYRGKAATFRIPGLAGTAGQKLLSIWNGSASKIVHVNQLSLDLYQTIIKAVTVAPPIIRVHRVTAAPTGGAALAKVPKDTALSSDAGVALLQGASADGTQVTLAATIAAGTLLSQEYAPRMITAAGYEPLDRAFFLDDADLVLRPNEGIVLNLDYAAATQNPITDMWVAGIGWYEHA